MKKFAFVFWAAFAGVIVSLGMTIYVGTQSVKTEDNRPASEIPVPAVPAN